MGKGKGRSEEILQGRDQKASSATAQCSLIFTSQEAEQAGFQVSATKMCHFLDEDIEEGGGGPCARSTQAQGAPEFGKASRGHHWGTYGESTRRLPSCHETRKHEERRKGRQVINRLGQVLDTLQPGQADSPGW